MSAFFVWFAPLLFILLLFGSFYLVVKLHPRIKFREVGVVVSRETGEFIQFLPPGRHLVYPWWQLQDKILTGPRYVNDVCTARTRDGVPVGINWSLAFFVDEAKLLALPESLRTGMAFALPKFATILATSNMNNVIRHVLEKYNLTDMWHAGIHLGDQAGLHQFTIPNNVPHPAEIIKNPGFHEKLEDDIKQAIQGQLGIFGMLVMRVMLSTISLPEAVEEGLQAASKELLHARSHALALAQLHYVVRQFTAEEVARLAEMERLRAMNGRQTTFVDIKGTVKNK